MRRSTRLTTLARLAMLVPVLAFAVSPVLRPAVGAPPPPPPPGPPAGSPPVSSGALTREEVEGERVLDEAARWISKGEEPPTRLDYFFCDLDYSYDDGSTQDQRKMKFWFRNPDAFTADTEYAGRDSRLMLIGERGFLIRDRIRVTDLNASPTMKEALPMLRNFRAILREVGRLVTPSTLKSPGARFRLVGVIPDPRATGGRWFKVVRTAPREGDITFYFGSAPTRDGTGVRAIAPDRLVLAGDPGSKYQGDEYRLEGWLHDDANARNERMRYPRNLRLYAIGIDSEEKPTMRAVIRSLEVNGQMPEGIFTPPF